MVAAIQDPDRVITAIHRTYLRSDGQGKAAVRTPKMAFGPIDRGAVRLAKVGRVLGLAEGIETALSAFQLFAVPVWAALGSRIHKVWLPHEVAEVWIFADNGVPGQEAAAKARDSLTKAGKRVAIRHPPETFGDWNDALSQWHKRPAGDWEF